MTIDSQNRMWVIETGRRNFLSSPDEYVDGAAGVWIIDLDTGDIISKYYFPQNVASHNSSFVNDIVLDEARDIAYLTDANGNGGIIVYNHHDGTSRRYSGASTMRDPSYVMIIDGTNYGDAIFTTPIDGIAITDDLDALLYCDVQGTSLYRVPTAVLRNFSATTEDITAAVQYMGPKNPSDGMKYLSGNLYYGDLPRSTYHSLQISSTDFPNTTLTEQTPSVGSDPTTLRWVRRISVL
jgi:hypothetical protein